MNILKIIKKIPGAVAWRTEKYWKEYVLKMPLHLRRFFVLRTRALKEGRKLRAARKQYGTLHIDTPDPLVSVTTATWNRGKILTERVIPRVLAQTYENLEIIIVGDHCTDDTEARIKKIKDPRITFLNLAERGNYPENKRHRHMVAGSVPYNKARSLARGLWLAHLDDDEEWEPDHVEALLNHARSNDLELVWGKTRYEVSPGEWDVQGAAGFRNFNIPHSSVLMRTYLRLYEADLMGWKLELGGDRHRLRRMYYSGVRAGFLDKIVTTAPLRPGTTSQWEWAEDREGL